MSAPTRSPATPAVAATTAATAPPLITDSHEGGIAMATWPAATPSPHTNTFFTIVCGNTHYHWAMHEGIKFRFVPHTFWKTCALKDADIRTAPDPCRELKVHLPDRASDFIFGEPRWTEQNNPLECATPVNAIDTSVTRRMPVITVYVVSTNVEHERGLQFLFSQVPCRLYKLQASDFWEMGLYPGIGVDRVAALRGAQSCFGLPALVLDGGTALTYTAANADGQLLGGGIAPGLAWRLKALHRSLPTELGDLPAVEHDKIEEIIDKSKPLPCFAKNFKQAVAGTVLREIGYECYFVVKTWLREVGPASPNGSGEEKEEKIDNVESSTVPRSELNQHRTVTVTGGDMELIASLLETSEDQFHSGIIPSEPGSAAPKPGDYTVERFRGTVHYGMAHVLFEKSNDLLEKTQEEDDETKRLRIQILGLRVAIRLKEFDDIRRGSIVSINRGRTIDDDWFLVRHDDNKDSYYNLIQVHDGLKLYLECGEVHRKEPFPIAQRQAREEKIQAAQKSVVELASASDKVKEHAASTAAAAAAAAAAATPKKKPATTSSKKVGAGAAAKAGSAKPSPVTADSNKKKSATKKDKDTSGSKKKPPAAATSDPPKTTAPPATTVAAAAPAASSVAASSVAASSVAASSVAAASTTSTTEAAPPEATVGAVSKPAPSKKKSPAAAASGTTKAAPQQAASKKRRTESPTPPAASKKAKTSAGRKSSGASSKDKQLTAFVGRRVAKHFPAPGGGKDLYFGTVRKFLPKTDTEDLDLWKIHYDDGDKEEYDMDDMTAGLALYDTHKEKDPQGAEKE